jgi:hypothetical protein
MSLSSIPRPLVITMAIVIPLCIIIAGGFFVFKKVKQEISSSLKKTKKHIPITRISDGSPEENRFNEIMIDFYSMADMAQGIMPVDTTLAGREKSLEKIQNIGIYYWNRNLELLDSVNNLNLNEQVKQKIGLYKEYCNLNKACYQLIYQAVDKHSRAYDAQIDRYFIDIAKKSEEIMGK